jgi:hypothetical protein
MPFVVLLLVSGVSLIWMLAGCGETTTTRSTPAAPPAKPGSVQAMVNCLHGVGYVVKQPHPTSTLVRSPAGRLIANIDSFPTQKKAQEFANQLITDKAIGGKNVAVVLTGASSSDRAVVVGCLSK